ncbi:MAG: hypothetical protein JWR11_3048 [Mycobacterium sp.]|nr:hypothetical protein [Mycobacterium sp.]
MVVSLSIMAVAAVRTSPAASGPSTLIGESGAPIDRPKTSTALSVEQDPRRVSLPNLRRDAHEILPACFAGRWFGSDVIAVGSCSNRAGRRLAQVCYSTDASGHDSPPRKTALRQKA